MFRGHSGRITNLKFSKDGKYLLSTGGRDKCIFQWRYIANIPSKEEDEMIIDPTLIVDEPSISPEMDKKKQAHREQIENIPEVLQAQEIKKYDNFLASKPYFSETTHNIPSGFKESRNSVIE